LRDAGDRIGRFRGNTPVDREVDFEPLGAARQRDANGRRYHHGLGRNLEHVDRRCAEREDVDRQGARRRLRRRGEQQEEAQTDARHEAAEMTGFHKGR
jgi:hypothetical protein